MTLKQTKQRGFTIVELLIVVVIIAILAAITIVAYNGIQNRAKTSSAAASASAVQKKAEIYAVDNTTSPGNYPTTLSALTGAASTASYSLASGSVTLQTTALVAGTAPSSEKTINFYTCDSAKGYKIQYYDFTQGTVIPITGGTTGTCTIATS